jgi:hypothetical protein
MSSLRPKELPSGIKEVASERETEDLLRQS